MPKKGYEIDERAWEIIRVNAKAMKKYFPSPQDMKMFERKVDIELIEKSKAEIKAKVLTDGRADNTANATGTGTGN